jgi:hypothetical protein
MLSQPVRADPGVGRPRRTSSVDQGKLAARVRPFGDPGSSNRSTTATGTAASADVRVGTHAGQHVPVLNERQDGFAVFDASSVLNGDFEVFAPSSRTTDDWTLGLARTNGGVGNAYARGQWTVDWSEGTNYRSEMDVFLPVGFYARQLGAVQLMGWDTFPILNNHMRLIIWRQDRLARLFLKSDGVDSVLSGAFAIPEGRWVRIAIEQNVADTEGWSRVYMDGHLVAQGTGHTSTPYPVTRMRYGLVAVDAARQTLPLEIWLRNVTLTTMVTDVESAALSQKRC